MSAGRDMRLFPFAAVAEGLTGLAMLTAPALIARVLFGAELDPAGMAIARVGGIGFICLGLVCWPNVRSGSVAPAAQWVLWVFQPAVAACLVFIALGSSLHGILMWPAVAYHVAATILLGLALRRDAAESHLRGH